MQSWPVFTSFLLRLGWFLPQTRDINGHGVPGVGAVPEMQNPEVGTRGVPGVAEMIPSAAPVLVCPAASCGGCGFDAGLSGRLSVFPARISNVLALLRKRSLLKRQHQAPPVEKAGSLAVHHHYQHPLLLGVRGEARTANMWKTRVRRHFGSEQSIRTVAVKYLERFCCNVFKTVRTGNRVMNSAGEECRWLFRGQLRSRPPAGRLGGCVGSPTLLSNMWPKESTSGAFVTTQRRRSKTSGIKA